MSVGGRAVINPLQHIDNDTGVVYDKNYYPTAEQEGTSQLAFLVRNGFPTGFQREDRFSPVNTFAFSPLAQELFTADNAILGATALYLAKNQPAAFERIVSRYMDNVTKILVSVVESGKAHPLTALNASTAFAVVAHRFGIITDSGYLKMSDQTRSIVDKLIQINFVGLALDGLSTLVESGAKLAANLPLK